MLCCPFLPRCAATTQFQPSDHLNSYYFAAGIPTRDPPSDTSEHPFSATRPSLPDSYPAAPLATDNYRAQITRLPVLIAAHLSTEKRLKAKTSTLPRPHATIASSDIIGLQPLCACLHHRSQSSKSPQPVANFSGSCKSKNHARNARQADFPNFANHSKKP